LDLNNGDWFEQKTQAAEARGAAIGLVYAKTCSNPSGFMLDIKSLIAMRDRLCPDAPIVVDNSWLSALYDPVARGADVVVESLTKHVGAGHLIGGMTAFASTPLGSSSA
jgi:cystathionine beta-lyase/cystathionine gamma-synthase